MYERKDIPSMNPEMYRSPAMTREELDALERRWANDLGVAAKDVRALVKEYRSMLDNLTFTQTRCTELLLEMRELKQKLQAQEESAKS
jgi:hypothetical protein